MGFCFWYAVKWRGAMLLIFPLLKRNHPPISGLNCMGQQTDSKSVEKITQNHILGVFLCNRFEKWTKILLFSNWYSFHKMAPRPTGSRRLQFTNRSLMVANSHSMLEAPVLVWSPKLSNNGSGLYLGGWPPRGVGFSFSKRLNKKASILCFFAVFSTEIKFFYCPTSFPQRIRTTFHFNRWKI